MPQNYGPAAPLPDAADPQNHSFILTFAAEKIGAPMSTVIRLRKGLDIKIIGRAANKVEGSLTARTYALKPTDFIGMAPIPKVVAQEGQTVLAGDPVFFEKARPDILCTAPVSGTVKAIERGAKRAITAVVIEPDAEIRYREFAVSDPAGMDRGAIVERLKEAGAWPLIRQRPFNVVANPDEEPKAIHVSGFDSAPLGVDYNLILQGRKQAFQRGLDILRRLTAGKVHLNLSARHKPVDTLNEAEGVQINWFDGPHPAGNVGIQIHHVDPINKGDTVWHVRPQDVITIGKLFHEGRFDPERIVAVAGPEVLKPRYFRTRLGASLEGLLEGNLRQERVRVISGNVLTGTAVSAEGHLGYHDDLVSVIAEGDQPEMFGWLFPSYPRPSASNTYPIILNDIPEEGYTVNTSTHGEERAFVVTGQYEKVLPMDLYPVQLLKAILARDFELMEGLGIYEVDAEDLALCEFVCTSKIDVQSILREGLEFVRSQS
jgi:Na+-transporting NADH:ubiquinone oxidoreductase subunit A